MKRSWQCPKCQSFRVGYLEALEDQGHQAGDRRIGKISVGSVLGFAAYTAHGDVEAFVCTDCGYFEEYVKNAQAIQWDSMKGFRWCRPEAVGRPPVR
jgi:hypothetical protein